MPFASVVVKAAQIITLAAMLAACSSDSSPPATNPPEVQASVQLGGTLSGLESGEVHLQYNGETTLLLDTNGPFEFAEKSVTGSQYHVSISNNTSGQRCDILAAASGNITETSNTSISINCAPPIMTQTISGQLSGELDGVLSISNNGVDVLELSNPGPFSFAQPVNVGDEYFVNVIDAPENASCAIDEAIGIASDSMSDIQINCVQANYDLAAYPIHNIGAIIEQPIKVSRTKSNQPVNNLTITDFNITEDGAALSSIQHAHIKAVPTSTKTLIMIDISGSISDAQRQLIKDQVKASIINSQGQYLLAKNQTIAIASFDEHFTLVQDFTADTQALVNSIESLKRGEPTTALFQAAESGLNLIDHRINTTTIEWSSLIIISDGRETSGLSSPLAVSAAREGKRVYAITGPNANLSTLNALTGSSRHIIKLSGYSQLSQAIGDIHQKNHDEANSIYVLSYASAARDNADHSINVSLATNQNTAPEANTSTSINASAFTTPAISVNISGPSNIGLGGEIQLRAETRWATTASNVVWSNNAPDNINMNLDTNDRNKVILRAIDGVGTSATITATDTNSGQMSSHLINITNGHALTTNVSGLDGELILNNGRGDSLSINSNGLNMFANKLAEGDRYDLSIHSQPAQQLCTFNKASGHALGTAINVDINCTDKSVHPVSIAVDISGLQGQLQLSLNAGNSTETLALTKGGLHLLSTTVITGTHYEISIQQTPDEQDCHIDIGSGVANKDTLPAIILCRDKQTNHGQHYAITALPLTLQSPSLITLPVIVTNTLSNESAADLDPKLFYLQEDNQRIAGESFFSIQKAGEIPLIHNILIAIDIGSSLTEIDSDAINALKIALKSIIQDDEGQSLLATGDKISLQTFDGNRSILTSFTNNTDELIEALDSISLGDENTNLYDTLFDGMALSANRATTEQIEIGSMIIITDGRNDLSERSSASVINQRKNTGAHIIALYLNHPSNSAQNEDHIKRLKRLIGDDDTNLENINSDRNNVFSLNTFDELSIALQATQKVTNALSESIYVVQYASPKRAGSHTLTLGIKGNLNPLDNATFSHDFIADGYTSAAIQLINETTFQLDENTEFVLNLKSKLSSSDEIVYTMTGGADQIHFSIDRTTGQLFFNAPDMEAGATDADANYTYEVQVSASDGSKTASQDIQLSINDVNEFPLTFENGLSTSIYYVENSTAMAYQAVANDADYPPIIYSIEGPDAPRFTFDTTTGEAYFITPPNFESPHDLDQNNIFDIVISARSGEDIAKQTISITVTDLTEVSLIGDSSITYDVTEFDTASESIFQANATDRFSQGLNISLSGADSHLFSLDANNEIQFQGPIDFENPIDHDSNNQYALILTYTAGDEQVDQTFTINIIDRKELDLQDSLEIQQTRLEFDASSFKLYQPPITTPFGTNLSINIIGPDASLFFINDEGWLELAGPIRFETPSDADHDNTYLINIIYQAGGESINQSFSLAIVNRIELDLLFSTKRISLSWNPIEFSVSYTLTEKTSASSGYTPLASNLTETNYTHDIAIHKMDWANHSYIVTAYDSQGNAIISSQPAFIHDEIISSIEYIKSSNSSTGDNFSANALNISADGTTIAVGAFAEASCATGISDDPLITQTDTQCLNAGAVYIFRFNGTRWYQQAYIKAPNSSSRDFFGSSTSLSQDGNTLVVGSKQESSCAVGISNTSVGAPVNGCTGAGAAYVFQFDGTQWSEQAYIKASNTNAGDQFGYKVNISNNGEIILITAPYERSCATGINDTVLGETNNSCINAGAGYLFSFDGTQWHQQYYIKPSVINLSDKFGWQTAMNADASLFAMSSINESSCATGINNNTIGPGDNSCANSGAAYLFSHTSTGVAQTHYIKASNTNTGDAFGWYMAFNDIGDTLAISAQYEDSCATGVNNTLLGQADNNCTDAGAVYLLRNINSTWQITDYIKASNTGSFDGLGQQLALSADGDTLALGAPHESSCGIGVNSSFPDPVDNNCSSSGAVYLFNYANNIWQQQTHIKAPNASSSAQFGSSLSLSSDSDSLVIGADTEESCAQGINPYPQGQNTSGCIASGAVYSY